MPDEPKKLLDVPEVAAALNISISNVYRLIKAEQIPYFRIGNLFRFDLDQVLASAARTPKESNE